MSGSAVNSRWDEFRERLSVGIRSTLLLLLPAAIGYLLLSEEIIGFLLERGVFSARSTELVSSVLSFFVLGLVPFALFQLFLRAFYALQDTKTPFLINCAAVALNIGVNLPLYAWLGVRGLAAGHAIAYTFGAAVQAWVLSRRIGGLDGGRIRSSAARIGAAGIGMGVSIGAAAEIVRGIVGTAGTGARVTILVIGIGVGVGSYLGLAHVFKVEELGHIRAIIARRAPANPHEIDPEGR
jgi:putative peptidoglycan lipid II flippase